MREMQAYHAIQLLLFMQRVSNPVMVAHTETLDNKHPKPLTNQAGKIFLHPTVSRISE